MNQRDVRIFDYVVDADGKRTPVLNKKDLRTLVAKESNQIKHRKSNDERKQLGSSKLKLGQIFTVTKLSLSWLVGTAVSRRNSRHLNHLIPTNERKNRLERRSDLKSRSEESRNKSDEKRERRTVKRTDVH